MLIMVTRNYITYKWHCTIWNTDAESVVYITQYYETAPEAVKAAYDWITKTYGR
jgi:endonuclease V-like protein UPF0215 family